MPAAPREGLSPPNDRYASFYGVALLCVIAFFRGFPGLRVRGREHLPRAGGVIIAANHVSYFDPPAVGAAFAPRHLSYFAKAELFAFKPFGALIGRLNAFPVDRSRGDVAAIRKSVAILESGRALLLFPEGGRNLDGTAEPKSGIALLARLTGAPVVPAHIAGTRKLGFRRTVTVAFGEPLSYPKSLGKDPATIGAWLSELMGRIAALEEVGAPQLPAVEPSNRSS